MSLHHAQERWLLFTLAAVQFSHIMDFMLLMPLGPQLMRLFEINPQEFSLLVSGYTFSAGIFGFISAFFMDRFDRKKILLFLYTGFVLGTLACALAPGYAWLLLARILTGAFGGILSAVVFAVVGDAIPMERRGRAMGVVTTAFSVASVLGVPVGLFLAAQYHWHIPFFALAFLGCGIWLMILRFVPKIQAHLSQDKPAPKAKEILSNAIFSPAQRYALLLTAMMMLGQFSIIPFISPSMVANVGFSEAQLTYIYLLGGLITLFTGPWIGRLADRYGKGRVMLIFFFLSTLPQILVTHMPPISIPVALLITTSFFVVSGGRFIPAMALMTGVVPPHQRGSFMSIQSSLQQVMAGLAALIAGAIVREGAQGQLLNYPYIGYLAVISSLVCIWLGSRLTQLQQPESQEAQIRLKQA